MYSTLPHFVLGFHGCDKTIADEIISHSSKHLERSTNEYDWLGHGIYFWENNPARALEYANLLKNNPKRTSKGKKPIKTPAVVGAIIDLGYCLNLLEAHSLGVVKQGYRSLHELRKSSGSDMPQNIGTKGSKDLLLRNLDCAVIEAVHAYNKSAEKPVYDTVRGMFIEGKPIYRGAGIFEKSHIQICVRNPNCIKGYFHPRQLVDFGE
jgi:hypothetical protein